MFSDNRGTNVITLYINGGGLYDHKVLARAIRGLLAGVISAQMRIELKIPFFIEIDAGYRNSIVGGIFTRLIILL
jgi:hypothetical protein